jgi:hypothetical protein
MCSLRREGTRLAGIGRAESQPPLIPGAVVGYKDAEGQATDDPAAAASGEIVEYDDHALPRRRTRFFMTGREMPWLPVSEPAFLLWVLIVLMVIWLVVGLVLLT